MAAGRVKVGSAIPLEDPGARVAAVVARHERTLLRVARQASLCHDDALDAYQRALEIFVRRVGTVDPATELAWLKVVVRHEAIAIRRARSESVTGDELDLDAFMPGSERTVEDQIASGERLARSAEALRALKPDEARALMMKAHGLTYEEIARRNGWTYTKVNRAITEGRRRFMRVYEGIESGEECERFAPIVEALATGSATSAQILEIRPHLRHCVACRATVRDLHLARLRRASLFWPLFAFLEPLQRLLGVSGADVPAPRTDGSVFAQQTLADVGPLEELPGSDPSDAGIQFPVEPDELVETSDRVGRLVPLKNDLMALLHRANASDVATGVHLSTASGGGRLSTMATVLALCLSSVGAGSMCLATGVLPGPDSIISSDRRPTGTAGTRAHEAHPRDSVKSSKGERNAARTSSTDLGVGPRERDIARETARPRGRNDASRNRTSRVPARPADAEFGFEAGAAKPTSEPQAEVSEPSSLLDASPTATHSSAANTSNAVRDEFDAAQLEFGP